MSQPSQVHISQSNISKIGSKSDLENRVNAAKAEDQWEDVGQEEGVKVWRIEQFAVKPWPKEKYGTFYNGDSYIVLYTYKSGNSFNYNIHFWLGSKSTKDEVGCAAYKAVELDDYLGTKPVQYREVEGKETSLFESYFDNFQVVQGDIASGFAHVPENETFEPRLLHLKGKSRVRVYMRELKANNVNEGDVFILDLGQKCYVYIGKEASRTEIWKKATVLQTLKDERAGKLEVVEVDDDQTKSEFFSYLEGDEKDVLSAEEGGSDSVAPKQFKPIALFRLQEQQDGSLDFTKLAEGVDNIKKELLDSGDVFILDNGGDSLYIWVGKNSDESEKKNAMITAMNYAHQRSYPSDIPIERIHEGVETNEFNMKFVS